MHRARMKARGLGLAAVIVGALAAKSAAAEPAPACAAPKTTCEGADGYYAASDDLDKVRASAEPLLKELRACLDAAGGRHVVPSLVVRFDEKGGPVTHRVDAPGYESLACVARVNARLAALKSSRETAIRCEYGCPKPPSPPAAAPPPVVAPSATPAPPPPQTTTPSATPPPPRYEKIWYGYQTLAIDSVAVGLFVAGLATETKPLYTVSAITYAAGAPIVHFVHGNVAPGFGSLAMRVFIPPVTLGLGAIAGLVIGTGGKGGDAFETTSGAASGLAVGMLAGALGGVALCMAIDAAGLGWEKRRVDDIARVDRGKPSFVSLRPTFDVGKNRGAVGLAGTF